MQKIHSFYMLTKKLVSLSCALALTMAAWAQQSFTGTWKTIDDGTKKAKSHVEIYKSGNKYYGKVAKLLADPPRDTILYPSIG